MPRGQKNPVSKPEVVVKEQNTGFKSARRVGGEEAPAPTMYIENRPQRDVLDHGLDDYRFHHVWVDASNNAQFYSYYVDGYRFVPYDEVKERIESDELRKHLYRETVDNRLAFGDTLRLMRIPTQQYLDRMQEGWASTGGTDIAQKARNQLEAEVEKFAEKNNTKTMRFGFSEDEDHGDKQTTTVGGEE